MTSTLEVSTNHAVFQIHVVERAIPSEVESTIATLELVEGDVELLNCREHDIATLRKFNLHQALNSVLTTEEIHGIRLSEVGKHQLSDSDKVSEGIGVANTVRVGKLVDDTLSRVSVLLSTVLGLHKELQLSTIEVTALLTKQELGESIFLHVGNGMRRLLLDLLELLGEDDRECTLLQINLL